MVLFASGGLIPPLLGVVARIPGTLLRKKALKILTS
jgi:hypothetical protein